MTHDDPGAKSARPPAGATIKGTIEFQNVREPARNVTVHVRVQDTSHADAAASTVAEQVLKDVTIVPGAPPLPFTVRGVPQNPRARHVLRVHADVDGSGTVTRGDFVSTESHPVPTGGQPAALKILAREVK